VVEEVLTSVLQFSPIVGVNRNQALDCRAGVLLTFSAGNEHATKGAVTNVARFTHGCHCSGLAVAVVAKHLFWLVLVALRGVFECQPDALTLIIIPGSLINRTFGANLAAIGNFSHFLSLGLSPNLNLTALDVIRTRITLQDSRQKNILID
jgi:hypothetical protein